jgi:hypothetical protein
MTPQREKAILIRSFKTMRADGHSIKTIYAMGQDGVVYIERRIVSTELNGGFQLIRKFGNFYYQYEKIVFKLDSFIEIAKDIANHVMYLNKDDILRQNDVKYEKNDKSVKILSL